MTLCSAIEAKRKEEEEGAFVIKAFVFQSNHYTYRSPASQWLDIACWWEVENKSPHFALLPHAAFAFFIKLPSSQPMSLLILFSSCVLLRRGKWESRRVGSLAATQGQATTMHLFKNSVAIATAFMCHRFKKNKIADSLRWTLQTVGINVKCLFVIP